LPIAYQSAIPSFPIAYSVAHSAFPFACLNTYVIFHHPKHLPAWPESVTFPLLFAINFQLFGELLLENGKMEDGKRNSFLFLLKENFSQYLDNVALVAPYVIASNLA
jgi:hypothetical protein